MTGDVTRRHVFLVGCARTGSTLLRHVLNRSRRIAIAPETHFMKRATRLELSARLADATDSTALERVVTRLYDPDDPAATGYWAWLRRNVAPEEVVGRLETTDRSLRALFSLLIEVWVERQGGPDPDVIGEKTPAHLAHVPLLAAWYPGATFVHTFRDPRGIYASELRRRREGRWGLKRALRRLPDRLVDPALPALEVVRTTLAWQRADDLDRSYGALLGPRYHLVRFEDLVREPERELRAVCALLGVEYDPGMLEIDVVGSSFSADRHAAAGFDPGAADRWRRHVGPAANRWFELALRRRLQRRGYLSRDGRQGAATREKSST